MKTIGIVELAFFAGSAETPPMAAL